MGKEKLSGLKAFFAYHLGLFEIPENTRKFIFTHFNFLIFTTIPGTFINTFLFRQDGRISTVAIYNGVSCFGLALVMHLSSKISLKKSPVFILRIGVGFFNIFFIVLLMLQGSAAKYMLLLALLNAIACGFYWQGYNEMVKLCTSEDNFDKTVSLIGLSSAVVTLVIPVLSGVVISYCPGFWGYTFIFVLSFIWSVYTAYLTTRLKNDKIAGRSNLLGVYRYIFTHKEALAVNLAELVRGIRNMSFPLFLSIIFFKFMTNEAALGVNSMLCGLASMIAYILAGRLIRPQSRLKYILAYSLISIVVFLPLFFVMNSAVLFLLAIVNAFITAFIDNPALGFVYTVFEKPVEGITFSQIMSAHEIFLATGRWIGYILLIVFSKSFLMLAIYALIANLSTIITWAVLRKFVSPTKKNSATAEI